MGKIKKKLVKIGWADAIEYPDSWISEKSAIKWGKKDNWVVDMVGWVLDETEQYILLATRYLERDNVYSGLFKIPKPWIAYRHELTEKGTVK